MFCLISSPGVRSWLVPRHRPLRTSISLRQQSFSSTSEENSSPTTKLYIDDKPIRTVMAPMVAASDYAFRRLVRQYDCDLCFTQMVHARNVLEDATFRRHHLDFLWNEGETLPPLLTTQLNCIEGAQDHGLSGPRTMAQGEGGPLMVQLAGHDPDTVVQAAQLILREASPNQIQGFDLNLGCPQGIARKGNYGAFLMEHQPDAVHEVLSRLRQTLPSHVLVSAKIRLPLELTSSALENRIRLLVETEINFLTIHGRTLKENKTAVGPCHKDFIKEAIEMVPPDFPVIANGGIERHSDIDRILFETGATAAMSSEALLERPNLFSKSSVCDVNGDVLTRRQLVLQQLKLAREYLDLCAQYPPLPGVLGSVGSFNIVKGHLFKILHRYLQYHVDLRNALASHSFTNLGQAMGLLQELEERYATLSDEDLHEHASSHPDSSWYRRHWTAAKSTNPRHGNEAAPEPTLAERKKQMQERIAKLREQRMAKEKQDAVQPQQRNVAA